MFSISAWRYPLANAFTSVAVKVVDIVESLWAVMSVDVYILQYLHSGFIAFDLGHMDVNVIAFLAGNMG